MWAFNMSLVTKFLFRIIRWTFYCDVYTHAHTQTDTVYTQTHCVHSVYTHTHNNFPRILGPKQMLPNKCLAKLLKII